VQWPAYTASTLLLFASVGVAHAQDVDPEAVSGPPAVVPPAAAPQTEESAAVSSPTEEPAAVPSLTEEPSVTSPALEPPAVPPIAPVIPPKVRDSSTTASEPASNSDPNIRYHWLDRTREVMYDTLWHSAEHVDRWFGSVEDDAVYEQLYGSVAPALLYTQHDGLRAQLRFNMNIPLPQVNDRFHAFIGRFDPNEFITERDEPSGAFARTYGPSTEDQTLFGIGYHQPEKQGSRFDASLGVRVALPMDPYVKGSWIFERGTSEAGLFSLRETLFWQHSEGAGATTRLDLERIYDLHWLTRFTVSATRSQESQGLRGYSSVLILRGLPARRAIAFEVGFDGSTQAPVPMHDYGFKVAYRQGILRRWLIMEVRTSVDWPRDYTYERRTASLGIGLGFEMLFGTNEFLARPVTF